MQAAKAIFVVMARGAGVFLVAVWGMQFLEFLSLWARKVCAGFVRLHHVRADHPPGSLKRQ